MDALWQFWVYAHLAGAKLADTAWHGMGRQPRRLEYHARDEGARSPQDEAEDGTEGKGKEEQEEPWILVRPYSRLYNVMLDSALLLHPAAQLVDGLWIGNACNAANHSFLRREGITGIINVTPEVPNFYERDIAYCNIVVRDDMDDDMEVRVYEETAIFIEQHIQKGGQVLVHCFVGRSRSVAICCYYMMTRLRFNFQSSYAHISQLRPHSKINQNFANRLITLGEQEAPLSSTAQTPASDAPSGARSAD